MYVEGKRNEKILYCICILEKKKFIYWRGFVQDVMLFHISQCIKDNKKVSMAMKYHDNRPQTTDHSVFCVSSSRCH